MAGQGRLTTHVLDTMHGRPAAGLKIRLVRPGLAAPLVEARTNSDGRCDAPLLEGAGMARGEYELQFEVGAYFRAAGVPMDRQFLDIVPVRFLMADDNAHYHVPLLVSPFGYSTYRGS